MPKQVHVEPERVQLYLQVWLHDQQVSGLQVLELYLQLVHALQLWKQPLLALVLTIQEVQHHYENSHLLVDLLVITVELLVM